MRKRGRVSYSNGAHVPWMLLTLLSADNGSLSIHELQPPCTGIYTEVSKQNGKTYRNFLRHDKSSYRTRFPNPRQVQFVEITPVYTKESRRVHRLRLRRNGIDRKNGKIRWKQMMAQLIDSDGAECDQFHGLAWVCNSASRQTLSDRASGK